MTNNDMENFSKELKSVEHLYPNVAVLARLVSLLKNPDVDQNDIGKLIKTDTSLTADVIRLSNSAIFGYGQECSDVKSALLKLGQKRILEVVNLSVSRNLFNQDLNRYGISSKAYWARSLTTGLVMEALTKRFSQDQDRAYTVGILHSVGMIIINRILNVLGVEVYWDSSISQIEWEEESTGYNYAIAGADVMDRWKFPQDFTDIIRHHPLPDGSPEPSLTMKSLNFTVNLINITGWQLQFYEDATLSSECLDFMHEYRISEAELNSMLLQTRAKITEIMTVF